MKKSYIKELGSMIEDANDHMARLDEMLTEMQDQFDNRSEKWQESEKGLEMQEELQALEEAMGYFDEAQAILTNIS